MRLKELVGPRAGRPEFAELDITGLTADSREVRPGFLFAALPGVKTDGIAFIPQAVAKGAAAVLVPAGRAPNGLGVALVEADDARRELALIAARFHAPQPETAVAVTGTNGKTSVVSFVRQIWRGLGLAAASIGTIGIVSPRGESSLSHTSPDPVTLHRLMAELAGEGVTHVALEASSHGLQQRRVDGMRFAAGAFTNISRDHLDYHASFADYLSQKLRLFEELLPSDAGAVVDPQAPGGDAVVEVARSRGLRLFTVGAEGDALRLTRATREGFSQRLSVESEGRSYDIALPLAGGFQTSNALVAAALCMACGSAAKDVLPLLQGLKGATGRLDHAGTARSGAPIFVDYAHTPDALATALDALRPYVRRNLVVVFGCGGDRDRGKRPQMGAAAVEHADLVYVTDDNPRSEDAAAIRKQILAAAPGAIEIGDRRQAIATAIDDLQKGDLLLVAGKGHEQGQIVGDKVLPFSDHEAVRSALKGAGS